MNIELFFALNVIILNAQNVQWEYKLTGSHYEVKYLSNGEYIV